jgi:hypothetical protein
VLWGRGISAGDRHRFGQLLLALFAHLPGEKGREVRRRMPAILRTGREITIQPVVGIELPEQEGLKRV